jgi:hypothetical protein
MAFSDEMCRGSYKFAYSDNDPATKRKIYLQMKDMIKKLTDNRKLKYIFVFLLVLVILIVVEVNRTRNGSWVELKTRDFMKGVSFYDKNGVESLANQNIQVRIKTVYEGEGRKFFVNMFANFISKRPESELEGFSYIININEINCLGKEKKILSSTLYDENDNVLYTKTHENEDWKSIPPKSDLEDLTKEICKSTPKKQ